MLKLCTAEDVKACFEKYLRKEYKLSKSDAKIASYDLLDEDTILPYLRKEWITTEMIDDKEYNRYLIYTDFSCMYTFTNTSHRFVFYKLQSKDYDVLYSLDIDPQEIEDDFDFIRSWN